jgi:hypothetical protein
MNSSIHRVRAVGKVYGFDRCGFSMPVQVLLAQSKETRFGFIALYGVEALLIERGLAGNWLASLIWA